jgi:hypothetical protein
MKRARFFGAWGISVVVGAGMLWACSSSTSENGNTGGGSSPDATTDDSSSYAGDSSSGSDTGIVPKKDGGGDGGTGVCGTTTTAADCYTCCDTVASDGGVSEFFTLQGECLCSAKHCDTVATCKNTFCANPGIDDAGAKCNACQDKFLADDAGEAGCEDPVLDQCAADPNCATGLECVINANCNALP